MDQQQREELGRLIVATRQARGWSQSDLARHAGIAGNTASNIERGIGEPQPAKLRAVLDTLDMCPLPPLQARAGYPQDVEIVRDVVGLWLMDVPEGGRAEQVRALIRCIVNGNHA